MDRRAAATVAREAERAGVAQIVYLGGLGDDAPDLSRTCAAGARRASGSTPAPVPVTTLRAAMVVGRGSAAFETIVALVDRLPVMIAPRWVSTPTQPIALADVVAYLAGVAGREEAFGETFDVGGPEVLTYREMIERIARAARPATAHRRGADPLAAALVVLAPPRHAGAGAASRGRSSRVCAIRPSCATTASARCCRSS